jgi:dihydroxyacetone kinase phosphotransfer subunit
MVSLLIVSHSAAIAEGVKALAEQMTQGRVTIAAAGGTLDGTLGTSTDLIAQALDRLDPSDGVLVLMDLGSAVMSAETALELSSVSFIMSNAPLVEGAILAAVEAANGATLAQTAAAAERACELVKIE